MSNIAVRVENLSKRYRIGLQEEIHDTLMGAFTSFVRNPIKNLRRLRRLTQFSEGEDNNSDVLWALKDISFEVKRGEVIGVIGRNGAGKSTLLKILSKITYPTRGRVELDGRVASLLEVGTGFHPELTGRENVYLNGTILGMTKAEIDHKFDEIVDFSGVEKFLDTPVKRYSSGMRVRLGFSVAAHLDPEVLLIDEVLAVGDASFQKKCLGKMKDVTGEGRTVLFVSHNMAAIEALCTRTILLDGGTVIFHGESAAAVEEYLKQNQNVNPNKSQVDLRFHPGRIDNSISVLEAIQILGPQGERSAIIRTMDDIVFDLTLNTNNHSFSLVDIRIRVYDSRDVPVCGFSTDIMLGEPLTIDGKETVRFIWDSCPLVPGTYSVHVGVRSSGVLLDGIRDAIAFEIHPTDVYGTGKFYNDSGLIIPQGRWEIV